MSAPLILLVTHSRDHFTVDRVAAALLERGARPFRLDTDRFPLELRLNLHTNVRDRPGGTCTLGSGPDRLSASDVRAIYLRRIGAPALPDDLAPELAAACAREAMAALAGFFDAIPDHARWVDPRWRANAAENKPHQLRLAARHGLTIPRTLISNDPDEVRAFARELGTPMVAKMFTPLTQSMGRPEQFVYTSEVSAADLDELDSLVYSPMIFQERIAKECDLRAIHVAGRFFVGRIRIGGAGKDALDYRRTDAEVGWEEDHLPEDVEQRLAAMMRDLGLTYGAIDLVRTPTGEHFFLEVNPAGEWGMLEKDLDLPISQALADALLEPITKGSP